jgi:hypothetical protein
MIEEYYEPGLSCIEDVKDKYGPIWDATTLTKVADCPRKHQIRVEMGMERSGPPSPPMVAGIAVHAGLEYYYSLPERGEIAEEAAVQVMWAEWDRFDIDRALMDQKYVHLSGEHLEQILRNYFHYWKHEAIDIFEPYVVTSDSLDLSDVVAAKFRTTSTGELVLGESSLIMRFRTTGGHEFIYSGKPDLPVVKQDGSLWAMDHKSTGTYLSDWWAKNFEVSNQLRGYMAMLRSLTGRTPRGGVINAIYVGKHATNPNSKATKFNRFQFDFAPDHIDEAIDNQYAWVKTIEHYRSTGYWPQACGYGGCDMPSLCRRDPDTRAEVLATDYQPSTRDFWNL